MPRVKVKSLVARVPPKWIITSGKSSVSGHLAGLGLLTSIDRTALAAYCMCWSHAIQAQAYVVKLGPMITINRIDKQ